MVLKYKGKSLIKKILWILCSLFILFILAVFFITLYLKSFLKSEKFLLKVNQKISKELMAKSAFDELIWSGLDIYSPNFSANGNDNTAFSEIKANGIRSSINISEIKSRTLKLENSKIHRLDILFNFSKKDAGKNLISDDETFYQNDEDVHEGESFWQSYVPDKFDFNKAYIEECNVNIKLPVGFVEVSKMPLHIEPLFLGSQNGLKISAKRGKVRLNSMPLVKISNLSARLTKNGFEILKLTGFTDEKGKLSTQLEFFQKEESGQDTSDFRLKTKYEGLQVDDFLPADWVQRLEGKIFGFHKIEIKKKFDKKISIGSGELNADGILLEALPILNQLAKYTRTERFKKLIFHKAFVDYKIENNITKLGKINLESAGLLRIEGYLNIKNNIINGVFKVGITPGVLAWLPGVEQNVFNEGNRDGFSWTTVKISGTLDKPENDLKGRIRQAILLLPINMIKSMGYQVLDEGKRIILDDKKEFILNKMIDSTKGKWFEKIKKSPKRIIEESNDVKIGRASCRERVCMFV